MRNLLKTGLFMATLLLSACSSQPDQVAIQAEPAASTPIQETPAVPAEIPVETSPNTPENPTVVVENENFITETEAKEIALLHANQNETDVTFVKVKFDYDDRIPEYEVEFYVGNMEYDYEIHAISGEILSYDQEIETPRNTAPNTNNTVTGDVISESQAKEIALAHAQLPESDVTRLKVEFDYDDGIPEYEIEFYVGNMEYDYEIHGISGDIISFGKEIDD